jgi:outer membrane scaffolding protein for murein synthesis (MipA/OmpV family)
MTLKRNTFASVLLVATAAMAAQPAIAQSPVSAQSEDFQGYVALGVATLPEYEGADAQQLIPFVAGRAQWGRRYIALDGVSARANLLTSPSWEAGPLISVAFGRDDDVESAAVARMAPLDEALELGVFAARTWSNVALSEGALRVELRAVSDVSDVYGGWQSSIAVGYAVPIGNRWRVGADVSATLISDDYAETYFSVTPLNAARSGLEVYNAEGGLKDVGLNLTGAFAINERWSLTGFAGYRRLLGDAADSPIVTREGSPDQFSSGLGLGFSF